jgi:hypothetical protein
MTAHPVYDVEDELYLLAESKGFKVKKLGQRYRVTHPNDLWPLNNQYIRLSDLRWILECDFSTILRLLDADLAYKRRPGRRMHRTPAAASDWSRDWSREPSINTPWDETDDGKRWSAWVEATNKNAAEQGLVAVLMCDCGHHRDAHRSWDDHSGPLCPDCSEGEGECKGSWMWLPSKEEPES